MEQEKTTTNSDLIERLWKIFVDQEMTLANLKNEIAQETCLKMALLQNKFERDFFSYKKIAQDMENEILSHGPLASQVDALREEFSALEKRKSINLSKLKSLGEFNNIESINQEIANVEADIESIKKSCEKLVNELINFNDDELLELRTIQQNYYIRMKASKSKSSI